MNIQSTKLEIIKMIADVQSEQILNNLLQLLTINAKYYLTQAHFNHNLFHQEIRL